MTEDALTSSVHGIVIQSLLSRRSILDWAFDFGRLALLGASVDPASLGLAGGGGGQDVDYFGGVLLEFRRKMRCHVGWHVLHFGLNPDSEFMPLRFFDGAKDLAV